MSNKRFRRPASAVFPVLTLTLVGCTVGPTFTPPAPPAAGAYLDTQESTRTDPGAPRATAASPRLRWWQAFGSAELDALVDRAIANNPSLAASNATLARAREQIAAVAGRRLPQIDANARVEREQINLAAYGFDSSAFPGIGNPTINLYTVGGGVGYDLDLFGANRRRLEQARAQGEAQRHATEAAHLTIAGRVVNQVLTIAAIRAHIATTRDLLSEDQRLVDLTEKRRRGGEGTLVEVLNVQSQLANDQGDLPQLEQSLDAARHMLAILIGVTPAELGPTDFDITHFALPREVPVALPADLVRRRPDILQAESDLHAAIAQIGVATAALYPDVTIGAALATATPLAGHLFTSGSRSYDLFGAVSAPIFHGGTLQAQKRSAEAAARASEATYRETVLEAFRQVADLLDALQADQRSLANQEGAAGTAMRSRDLSRRSFQVGNSGILTVLDAERLHQRAQLALVEARARQYLDVARLYVATAGGWTGAARETALNDRAHP
jgi:NodT family efflux transporter outer membrane factor (OMF) lipoprotein